MFKITARVIECADDIEARGYLTHENGAPLCGWEIPFNQVQGRGRIFSFANPRISLKIVLKDRKQNSESETFMDLHEVTNLVLIQIILPKNVDFTITQTRNGWDVKLNRPRDDHKDSEGKLLVESVLTSVTVGVGTSGSNIDPMDPLFTSVTVGVGTSGGN